MHKAKAVVVSCIDFRFQDVVQKLLQSENLLGGYDLISIAGGSRDFVQPVVEDDKNYVWKELNISLQLHDPEVIVVIDHQDCGGYAQDGTIPSGLSVDEDCEKHVSFLKKLKVELDQKYPDKKKKFIFAKLDGSVEELAI